MSNPHTLFPPEPSSVTLWRHFKQSSGPIRAAVASCSLLTLVTSNAFAVLAPATYNGSILSAAGPVSNTPCTPPGSWCYENGAALAAPGAISASAPGAPLDTSQLAFRAFGPSISVSATTSPATATMLGGDSRASGILDYFVEIVGPPGNVSVNITVSGGISAKNGFYLGPGPTAGGVSMKVAQGGSPFYGATVDCASAPNNPYNSTSPCYNHQTFSGTYAYTFAANTPIAVELNAMVDLYNGGGADAPPDYNYLGTFSAYIDPIFSIDPSFPNASSYTVVTSPGITQALGSGVAPPTLSKVFGAASMPLNGSTSLGFTINNPNASTSLTGVGFTDSLPAGLVVSTPNGLTGTCGGGAITATAGSSSVSLTGATLAGSASCTFGVNVTGNALGTMNNTTSAVDSVEGGPGIAASASVTVGAVGPAPPTSVPALHPWALGLLGLLLVVAGSVALRAHKMG